MTTLPESVVARLSDYRRHLQPWLAEGRPRVFSHELAELVGVTAAQVRRDLMTVGFSGSPAKGYDIEALLAKIGDILGPTGSESMTLVGVGHLGSALLTYFRRRRPEVDVSSAFDTDPDVVGRSIADCRVHPLDELERVLAEKPALVGIVAVPREHAQDVADRLVAAGIQGLINFAPVRLRVPEGLFVEHMDIATSAEKALFFARLRAEEQKREHTRATPDGNGLEAES